MINVGIVGAGHGTRVLAPAINMIAGARVVALATRSQKSIDIARKSLDIEIFTTDWRTLTSDPKIDAIAIAVPGNTQTKIAAAALEAGKLVFLEKPLATRLADAEAIATAAEQQGQNSAVDFIFPTLAPWQALGKAVQNNEIGAIKDIRLEWRVETYANKHMLDSWKTRTADGGGTLLNFASHSFHYLEWLFGEMSSLDISLSKSEDDTREGDTRVGGKIVFKNHAEATIEIDAAFPGHSCHRLIVEGTEGVLLLENMTQDYVRGFSYSKVDKDTGPVFDTEIETFKGDGRILATARILDTFLTTKAAPPGLGVYDALKTQHLLDAAYRSDLSGRPMIAGQDF